MKNWQIIILLLWCNVAAAQDYHYSQQYAVPMLLNPAMTGYTNCTGRFSAQYRNQWASVSDAFQTTTAAYEHTAFRNNANINGFAGFGLSLLNDQTGGGFLRQTSVSLSTAYHFYLDNDQHFISVGGQVGAGQQSVQGGFSYDAQFDGRAFNFSLPSGEAPMNANVMVFDVASGIAYSYITPAMSVNLGAALFHLSEPDVSLVEGVSSFLPRRLALHSNLEFAMNENISFIGRITHQRQGEFRLTNFGGMVKFNLSAGNYPVYRSNDNFIYAGMLYRWDDAVVGIVKLQLGAATVGVSYDFTTSNLVAASKSQGGFELVFSYNIGECENGGGGCPRF
jgi:type IX secretion system PorP/SprF family membrane protein